MFSLRKVLFVISLLGITPLAFGVGSGISSSSRAINESGDDSAPTVASFSVSPEIAATGQFIQFDWTTNHASSFAVSPGLFGEEEEQLPLPLSATGYVQVAPVSSTTYRAIAVGSGGGESPITTASVTIIPVTIAASRKTILAGESLTLTYSGPNNGSSYSLITLPANISTALHPESCSGAGVGALTK